MGEGSGSHDFVEKSLLVAPSTGEMGEDFSRSNDGLDVAVATSFRLVDSLCNGSKVGVFPTALVADVPAMDCPINGVEKDLCVSNFDGQFGFTNPVDSLIVGCPTTHSMSSDMHCHQSLLKQNHWELVSNTFKEENLFLNWVNPTGSDKDEDDRKLLEFVPLAQCDPNGGLILMIEEGDLDDISVEDDLEPSIWVSKMVKGFSKWVGFPIDSCERQCVDFFQRLKKVWEKQVVAGSLCRTAYSSKKGMREL